MAYELKKEGFKLRDIFLVGGIPAETYHYHVKQLSKVDKVQSLKEKIKQRFCQCKERFGYKRITPN